MKTLLCVEPDPSVQRLLSAIFAGRYRLLETNDGETALGMICTERPDLILLELTLPDLPGAEVCRLVKRDEELQSTRILMVTGAADAASRHAALQAGADSYISKPFGPAHLRSQVEDLLKDRASGRALSG